MSKVQAARFAASDFGLYVNMEAVNEKFADQIKAAHTQFNDQLDKAAEAIGKEQKGQIEVARKMFEPMFQAVEDAKTGLVIADFRPDGIALHTSVTVRPGPRRPATSRATRPAPSRSWASCRPASSYCGARLDPAIDQGPDLADERPRRQRKRQGPDRGVSRTGPRPGRAATSPPSATRCPA